MLDRRHRFRRAARTAAVAAIGVVVLASCGSDTGPSNKQNALRPAGPNAKKILDLTRPFFWVAVVIGLGVLFGTIYVAIRFRAKPGDEREPKQVHGNTKLEVSWTIIPALILAIMAVPTIATVFSLAKRPAGPDVVHVTVSARQWWWQYTYTDPNNGIITANEMHIPVDVPVALTLVGPPKCSGDGCYNNGVIHSFWVPELNGKKDVVPGRTQFLTIEASRPGTFLGQCAEYCGLSHANMRLRVIAEPMDQYKAWVQSQLDVKPKADLEKGVEADKWGCQSCHSFEAKVAGAVAPNLTKLATRCAFAGDIFTTNKENLTNWIFNAPSLKPMGNLTQHMPNFSEQGMTRDEAASIAQFLLDNTNSGSVPPPECKS